MSLLGDLLVGGLTVLFGLGGLAHRRVPEHF
jgi:hypothetical protein